MITAQISGIEYKAPRTIIMRYNVKEDKVAHTITMPIEDCSPQAIHAAIKKDYEQIQKDPNQEIYNQIVADMIHTEYRLDEDTPIDTTMQNCPHCQRVHMQLINTDMLDAVMHKIIEAKHFQQLDGK